MKNRDILAAQSALAHIDTLEMPKGGDWWKTALALARLAHWLSPHAIALDLVRKRMIAQRFGDSHPMPGPDLEAVSNDWERVLLADAQLPTLPQELLISIEDIARSLPCAPGMLAALMPFELSQACCESASTP